MDRFAAWEMLRRYILHETRVAMTNAELCDTIGVSSTYTIRLLKSVNKRLKSQNDNLELPFNTKRVGNLLDQLVTI